MSNLLYLDTKYQDYIFHDKLKNALHLALNTDNNIFIQGPAGTGKSLFLNILRKELQKKNKNSIVCTPTAVSAVNVDGTTIHSFFRVAPGIVTFHELLNTIHNSRRNPQKKEYITKLKLLDYLIIDEISMVRSDLFFGIDFLLKEIRGSFAPFGGVQVIILGDLLQLPPVVTDKDRKYLKEEQKGIYFFETDAYEQGNFKYIEFDTIFRQSHKNFGNLLNRMRLNETTELDLRVLEQQVTENYSLHESNTVYLATTNKKVKEINDKEFNKINGEEKYYYADYTPEDFKKPSDFPNDLEIVLKEGVKVMFVVNDIDKQFINGSIGFVKELYDDSVSVEIREDDETRLVNVKYHEWSNYEYKVEKDKDENKKKLKKYVKGYFKQIPLKVAYASTIHKVQSKTLDSIYLDLGYGAFAGGMTYVALSRVKTPQGFKLRKPIRRKDIYNDKGILTFLNTLEEIEYNKDIEIEFIETFNDEKEMIDSLENDNMVDDQEFFESFLRGDVYE